MSSTDPTSGNGRHPLDLLAEEFMERRRRGERPSLEEYAERYPELADEIRKAFPAIIMMERLKSAAGDSTLGLPDEPETGPDPLAAAAGCLGDFRIVREIGRGGMGVVYEARQISLKRTVAIKVLRFGAVADEAALMRFHREAETVAQMHHTNIVPIYAVGDEGGVHYFAMQLIEGRSLSELFAESRAQGKGLAPNDVADWGRQAAEALDYAHRRGVVHRDIKPSNLLLDANGIIWLTDFGLAKRGDEASLTVSGTLMGTPRYMSPEQAESLTRPVDHRTDVYSLGASLYELATGKPLFESATAHDVIAKILHDEPVLPRKVRPSLPRDLETVILTCLAKDPARRYPTAQAVADDLRAVLDARPIRARRARLPERALRYVRTRRREIAVTAKAVVISMILLAASLLAWRLHDQANQDGLTLDTDGPALLAEILPPDRDEPVIDEFTAPNRIPAALSEGSYRVRLSAPGQLSETYQLFVDRWQSRTFTVRLDDRRLWGPADRPASPVAEPVNLSGHDDLIEWDGDTLRRRDGKDGKVIWDLARGERPGWPSGREFDRWMKHLGGGGPRDIPAGLARPAPDLNGDGTRDLIFALKAAPAMLAVSGKDGALLWASPNTGPEANRPGSVAGQPVATDVDGDGTPDLIAVFSHDATDPTAPGRRVVAVSGKSGRWLWDHELGADALRSDVMPIRLDGRPVLAVVHGRRWLGLDPVTGRARAGPLELPAAPGRAPQYADLDGDGRPEVIAVAAGDSPGEESLSVSSIATGQPLWTTTIRARSRFEPDPWHAPAACPLIADLDGDGRPEVVVPAMRRDAGRTIGLRVLEGATGRQRWYRDLNIAAGGLKADRFLDGPDLDGDGCREIFMVSLESRGVPYPSRGKDRAFAFRVYADALSGKDGRPLWWWKDDFECPENYPSLDPLRWWGTGPDGWPQLLVSYGQLSSPLSRLPHAVRGGGPPLLVSYHEYWHPHTLSVLAAGTGRATQTLRGISRPGLADFDGDGLADLWGVVAGRFQAFRGTPPVAWRTLGDCKPARDFDGDAIRDVLHLDTKSRVARALSGRDGRLLWRADLSGGYSLAADYPDIFYGATTFPNPAGDLDGDGTSDVLASMLRAASRFAPDHLPLVAISGRTGERLWTAGAVPADAEGPTIRDLWGLDCRDLGDARGKALIALICTRRDVDVISAPFWWQLQLCRISARDGSIDWIRPLTERVSTVFQRSYGRAYVGTKDHLDAPDVAVAIPAGTGARSWAWEIVDSGQTFPHDFVDLDGDGIPELLLAVPVPADANAFAFELRAVSLGGGRMLWHRFLRRRHGGREYPPAPIFAAGDLDGDSKGEVVVVDVPAQGPGIEVTALDGRDGKPRWTWTGGDDGDWAKPESIPLRLVDLDGQGHRSVCLTVARNQLVLLDDRGRVRERRPAVVAKGAQSLEPGIRAPDGLPLPLSLSSQGDATVCRLALTTPSGRPGWSRSPEDDPRPKVPLPGANLIAPLLDPLLAIIATALNLALIVVPGVLIRLARRRRRWTLASLLTLPLVAAVVLASYRLMTFYLSDNLTMPEFFIFLGVSSVLGSFVVAFIRQLGSSLIRERWWAFGLTLGIPLALGLLGSRVGTANLDSSLHDRWEKWYCVALATIYIVGFLIVAWWSMRTVGSGLGRVIRVFRLRCRPTRHLEAASEAVTS